MCPVTFADIAQYAQAELSAVIPSILPQFEIIGVATSGAPKPNCLIFTKSVDDELLARVCACGNIALIMPPDAPDMDVPFLKVRSPRFAFAQIVDRFFAPRALPGVHPTVIVDETAEIDPTATVGPYCVIGPACTIGARTVLMSHVTLTRNVKVGQDCVLWSQTVLGDDGFGVERSPGRLQRHLPHLGGVVLGDGIHIGTKSTVAAGTIEPTRIGNGTMLDNHVHVAHNVQIGRNCQLMACVELSGSITVGDEVTLGPNSSVIQKVDIGDNSIVGIGSVVIRPVPANVVVAGVPARILRHLIEESEDK
jgi:UDP-3-O-[3-hydroxymyristoyl] glucosamine N-acyltransferase LpxD